MPKYSFVIPVFNCARYLQECVDSILAQTVTDFEVLLIDDGSVDGSGTLCDKLSECDERIRVFHKKNGGVSSARNLGIEEAEGQYLLFIDGDDTIAANCLETVEPVLSDEDSLPVFGMCFDYWRDGKVIRTDERSTAFPGSHTIEDVAKELPRFFENNVLSSACNKVFRTEVLREHGIRFPESMMLYEDLAFVLRCLPQFGRIHVIPRGLYHYRNGAGSSHVESRVADLDRLYKNLAPLNQILLEFGNQTGQIEQSATVLTNLYLALLEQHLLGTELSISSMRKQLPVFIGEKGFQDALGYDPELDVGKRKLLTQIERGDYRSIWMTFTGRRWKRMLRRTAKQLLCR